MFKSSMVGTVAALTAVLVILGLCWASYQLGHSQAKIEYITKEKEVFRYEKDCAVSVLAQPNIGDDAIAGLFDSGRL